MNNSCDNKSNNNSYNNAVPRIDIKTFAFFDLEATGLPELNGSKSKITELSMVACSKEHILQIKKTEIPRVLHKLSFCVNPALAISNAASQLSGLDNYLLEYEHGFTQNTCDLLNAFFKQLQQPICLVAHNGYHFDYPMLIHQMMKIKGCSNVDLYCIDSLMAFREIDNVQQSIPLMKDITTIGGDDDDDMDNSDDDILCMPLPSDNSEENDDNNKPLKLLEVKNTESLTRNVNLNIDENISMVETKSSVVKANSNNHNAISVENSASLLPPEQKEKSPVNGNAAVTSATSAVLDNEMIKKFGTLEAIRLKLQFKSDEKPFNWKRIENETTPKKAKPNLNNDFANRTVPSTSTDFPYHNQRKRLSSNVQRNLFPKSSPRKSFKLTDVYERYYGEKPKHLHNAECDAITLLKCVISIREKFIEYAESNYKRFYYLTLNPL